MDLMTGVVVILVALTTASGSIGVIYVILKQYFDKQNRIAERELAEKKRKDHFPIQMQAYERLILLLERINPERLVFRSSKPGMSARILQSDIKKVIRDEFDHNLTQQLYISTDAWEAVKAAKEEVLNILDLAAEQVHRDANALEFSRAILEVSAKVKQLPTEVAVNILKAEFRKKLKQ